MRDLSPSNCHQAATSDAGASACPCARPRLPLRDARQPGLLAVCARPGGRGGFAGGVERAPQGSRLGSGGRGTVRYLSSDQCLPARARRAVVLREPGSSAARAAVLAKRVSW